MQYQSCGAPKLVRKCEIEHWLPCGADGRSGGRSVYGHVITKFSRMGSLLDFLTHGAPLRASRPRAPLLKFELKFELIFFRVFLVNVYSCS